MRTIPATVLPWEKPESRENICIVVDNVDIDRFGGVNTIPRSNTSGKAKKTEGAQSGADISGHQAALETEKKKLELEKEQATLQSAVGRERAEAERDLLKATLEQERMQAAGLLEYLKMRGEQSAGILPRPVATPPGSKTEPDANAGYITELVGYHAMKRVSADISRGVSAVVGIGNDVRILIVDRLDYAPGDIPFIEVTSQLSVFEVRCRKQIATNKEIADLAIQKEEQEENEKIPGARFGATRLAPLAALPFFLPAITKAVTAIPAITGIIGTTADIAGYFRAGYSFRGRNLTLKTEGLIAAVAASLRSDKRYVYIYNFYSMDTTGPQSRLMNMYAGVLDCSGRLAQSRNRLQYFISKKTGLLAELTLSLKKLEEGRPSAEQVQDIEKLREDIQRETLCLDRANMEVLASDAIHAELGTFITNITMTGTAQPVSKLAQAVFREKVHELKITHLLYLGVLSSGGESVTRRWLFGTGTTSYLGGAVVSYVLSRIEGEILASDILPVLYSFGFDPAGQRQSPLRQVRFEKQEQKK